MLKKLKSMYYQLISNQQEILSQSREVEWAHVYHDSIRGDKELENLSLKIGRWAGNYSLLYIVHRILKDFEITKVVEFGLGESTKFISTFNESNKKNIHHVVIEQSEEWKTFFKNNYPKDNYQIQLHALEEKTIYNQPYNGYENVDGIPIDADLYLIDGPFGTKNYSRYDLVKVAENFPMDKEFIIVLDDYNRKGEQETGEALLETLTKKGIKFHKTVYKGKKHQLVVATEKYRYALTL